MTRYIWLITFAVALSAAQTVAAATDRITLNEKSLVAVLPGYAGNLAEWNGTPLAPQPYGKALLELFVSFLQSQYGARVQPISNAMIADKLKVYHIGAKPSNPPTDANNSIALALHSEHFTHVITINPVSKTSAGMLVLLEPSTILDDARLDPGQPITITVANDDGGNLPGSFPAATTKQLISGFGVPREDSQTKKVTIGCINVDDEPKTSAWYVALKLPYELRNLYLDPNGIESNHIGRLFKRGYVLSNPQRMPLTPDCKWGSGDSRNGAALDSQYYVYGRVDVAPPDSSGIIVVSAEIWVEGPTPKPICFWSKDTIEERSLPPQKFWGTVMDKGDLVEGYIAQWQQMVEGKQSP